MHVSDNTAVKLFSLVFIYLLGMYALVPARLSFEPGHVDVAPVVCYL